LKGKKVQAWGKKGKSESAEGKFFPKEKKTYGRSKSEPNNVFRRASV